MSNGDEILNALAHGSLAEFGNAVLCHHQVRQVLDRNKQLRHIRGGLATRRKYKGE